MLTPVHEANSYYRGARLANGETVIFQYVTNIGSLIIGVVSNGDGRTLNVYLCE